MRIAFCLGCAFALAAVLPSSVRAEDKSGEWPPITQESKPWTFWWWMGSAVDAENITRELTRYRDAGLGGVHIIPIYGAKGYESRYIEYLSPKWMEMLRHTVAEAKRLGLGVDMTTGTGWCFGGPNVSDEDANATAVPTKNADGTISVSQKPSGVKVKRAAPGGAGWMLNLLYPNAMDRYLQRFTDAFAKYDGPKPHAQYHDSYEYKSDWSPDFLEQFKKRRGYDLAPELDALFFDKGDADHVARVKCDYRETVSDLIEESIARWSKWSHDHGFVTRNQAHGSPGNWLDIYAAADIPETEMFHTDRDILISKFASSAAHVTGKNLVSAETGTWLTEHFCTTLADLKYLVDDMFLAGVNRITWHGTAYSPDDAPWPGWCFYASTDMNPRNAIWRDVPALNAYIARVQSVLQSGRPDSDILLYWPIHDLWHNDKGLVQQLTVHKRDWFNELPIGKIARMLWRENFLFDYISDRQLQNVKVAADRLNVFGNSYRVILIPQCEHIPIDTLDKLLSLVREGATVIFENHLPHDVSGAHDLEKQRAAFQNQLKAIDWAANSEWGSARGSLGAGHIRIDIDYADVFSGLMDRDHIVPPLTGGPVDMRYVRRKCDGFSSYFIVKHDDDNTEFDFPVYINQKSVVSMAVLNPMTGLSKPVEGKSGLDPSYPDQMQVDLKLKPRESLILLVWDKDNIPGKVVHPSEPAGDPVPLNGKWNVKFIEGGTVLPKEFSTEKLASWTELGGEDAKSFAGTARYTLTFDAPDDSAFHDPHSAFLLDLGKVCQSARVRLNGSDLGTLIIPPFRVAVDHLKPKDNVLEVEVTNTSANRIRDLDVRKVPWKIFHDINVVNLDYKPFDASSWPIAYSGLLGPVTLTPQKETP